MRVHDVLIIGGGPAGASAAILLARAGRRVAVLEKAAFPRRKVCGEFIAAGGIARLRDLGLGERIEQAAGADIRRLVLWLDGRSLEAPLRARPPFPRALARETLDALLLAQAARCGAEVLQPAIALALRRVSGGFVCRAASRRGAPELEIQARAVIAAHGSWEPGELRTQPPHLSPAPDDLLAFKAHLRGAVPPGAIVLAPAAGGYAGLVERGPGRVTFACCLRRDLLEKLRAPRRPAGEGAYRHFFGGLDLALEGEWRAAGPLRPGARPVYANGLFAVGNAAGEPHSVVGEGITLAMHSAALLCGPLAAALSTRYSPAVERAVARRYALAWHRHIAWRLWVSARLAALAMDPASLPARLLAGMPAMLSLAARLK